VPHEERPTAITTGPVKAKQVIALQRAAREQDRTRDLPGRDRDGLER